MKKLMYIITRLIKSRIFIINRSLQKISRYEIKFVSWQNYENSEKCIPFINKTSFT